MNLFENRPLSIDIDQDGKTPDSGEELGLDSLSNHALGSKQVDGKEKSKLAELFSKSNFPAKDTMEEDLKGEEGKERLPGTVPDLEPGLLQYGNDLAKFDSNVEDFLKDANENMIPENFGEMLEGDNPDMEKVVNFSTLNSQDQVINDDIEIKLKMVKIDDANNYLFQIAYGFQLLALIQAHGKIGMIGLLMYVCSIIASTFFILWAVLELDIAGGVLLWNAGIIFFNLIAILIILIRC